MPGAGRRVGVIGATGAVGGEVLTALSAPELHVAEILAVASDRSTGTDLDFRGDVVPVVTEAPSLRNLDAVFLCAPPEVSLEFARLALRAETPCFDLSGALAQQPDVPLCVAHLGGTADASAPLVACPTGLPLVWALVLRPLAEAAGLRRVVGTALEGAAVGGRSGIASLFQESLALFNQAEPPEPEAFPRPVAFDCLPSVGETDEAGGSHRERELVAALGRLLDPAPPIAITAVQVPLFVGHGSALAVETERPIEIKRVEDALAASPGVELATGDAYGPTTRAAAGRDAVLVGRVRSDASCERGLLLWLAADPLRLAAANAVAVAARRLLDA